MTLPGYATTDGTTTYRQRFTDTLAPAHFRRSSDLWLASIGLGTYLGEADAETDALYHDAITQALASGCNVLDTAINYRYQRSERVIGHALAALQRDGRLAREEVVVATKGGYLAFDGEMPKDPHTYIERTFIQSGLAKAEEIVEWNCIAPRYIDDQVERSRRNLGLECIDIYYLHNPEAQLHKWSRAAFLRRVAEAFAVLETKVADGKIRFYGTATWNGYRQPQTMRDYLSLAEIVRVAEQVGGTNHHFKVVQLPYNLAMPEALATQNQQIDGNSVNFLEAAHALGIMVMASATILQGKLSQQLPAFISNALSGLASDAQRAIQFTRSTPGITTALIGMKSAAHVGHNLAVAAVPPASPEQLKQLFRTAPNRTAQP